MDCPSRTKSGYMLLKSQKVIYTWIFYKKKAKESCLFELINFTVEWRFKRLSIIALRIAETILKLGPTNVMWGELGTMTHIRKNMGRYVKLRGVRWQQRFYTCESKRFSSLVAVHHWLVCRNTKSAVFSAVILWLANIAKLKRRDWLIIAKESLWLANIAKRIAVID